MAPARRTRRIRHSRRRIERRLLLRNHPRSHAPPRAQRRRRHRPRPRHHLGAVHRNARLRAPAAGSNLRERALDRSAPRRRLRQGSGAVLWIAVSPGARGYERFPYLPQALARSRRRAPVRDPLASGPSSIPPIARASTWTISPALARRGHRRAPRRRLALLGARSRDATPICKRLIEACHSTPSSSTPGSNSLTSARRSGTSTRNGARKPRCSRTPISTGASS